LFNNSAQHVCVAGTFNDWKPEENPLRRSAFGEWETTLLLAPGDYEYRFLIDGEWAADPLARQQVVTPFGSVHAVLHLHGPD
jgi:1,4-alpha-glucan branching enzyme